MNSNERKLHWENLFQTKDTTQVSWHQSTPQTSLKLIEELNLPKSSKIIEVGSGDSFLGDFLLKKGFNEITLLDISEKALNTIKTRLGKKGKSVHFLTADVTEFSSNESYNLWHDRAVFHFLTDKNEIQRYVENVSNKLVSGGYLILGTFSNNGPAMCSGLNVKQYTEEEISETFSKGFEKIKCFTENHQTPSGDIQNFLFSVFKKV
jgi:cyclopropane fatty-acyl-phospholipid synthase-like methyltransferase